MALNINGQVPMAITYAEISSKTNGINITGLNLDQIDSLLSASARPRGPTYRLEAGVTIGLHFNK